MPPRLRVVMVTPFPESPDRIVGGVAGVARYLVPALVADGRCDVTVIAPGAARSRLSNLEGVRVNYIQAIRGPGFATYWTLERRLINQLLAELQPDVVHFQGVGGWGLGCSFPSVLTLHGIAERDTLYSAAPFRKTRSQVVAAVERYSRARFAHIISISSYLQDEIGDQLRGRVSFIENPVEDAYFDVVRSPDTRSILFLGRITERKNVLGAIAAFQRLGAPPSVRLRVGGDSADPAYSASCRALADRLGVGARIDWLGSLTSVQVRREFATASCLLLPSFQETAPLVIEEAMAAGVPVVASALCGIPHLVGDGEAGFLVRPDDTTQIANALSRVLASAELQARMGAAGRAAAERRFRAPRVASETIAVYEAAAAGAAK